MRRLAPLLLLAGCGLLNAPREKPWHAQLFFVPAVDVEYDRDGLLYILGNEYGALTLATFDHDAKDRGIEGSVELTDGAPLDAYTGYGGTTSDWFNLAIHPGTGTPWLFYRGQIGPVEDGSFDAQIDLTDEPTGARGTIEFVDEETLFVSYERIDQSDEASFLVPVSGDLADPSAMEPYTVLIEGAEQALWGICDAEVEGGVMYATQCGGSTWVFDLDSGAEYRSEVQNVQDKTSEVSLHSLDYAGLSEYGAVVTDQTTGDYCALPYRDADSPDVVLAKNSRFATEGYCRGADALLPDPQRIDLRPAGDGWVAMYTNAGIVVLDEKAPKDAESDLQGSWCGTISDGYGNVQRMDLLDGGELVLSTQGSEVLHGTFRWSQGGDKLKFDYLGPSAFDTPDEHFEHWAVRVGDTLHIKSTVDRNSYDHAVNAGYSTFSGLWVPCQ
jgi:hypothetical protein